MNLNILLFLNLGTEEVILIVFVALLLFGGKKLPELAKGLGKGMREFKEASDSVKREIHKNINQLTAEEELKREEILIDAERQRLKDYNPSNYIEEKAEDEDNTISQLTAEEKLKREEILADAERQRLKDYNPSNYIEEKTEDEDNTINKTI